jgi:hypothetical protein
MTPSTRPSSNRPGNQPENPLTHEEWEALIRQSAKALPYPPTPNIADQVTARLAGERSHRAMRPYASWRPLWVAGALLALLLGLWSVPPVRAAILEFLQIGAVRIWFTEPTPEPTLAPTTTPQATPTPLQSLLNLAGATTPAEAEAQAGFSIRLPTYPTGLGPPDGVFYQEVGGPVVVLVWMNPEKSNQAEYSLQIFGEGAVVNKISPSVVMTTTVNGNPAAWTSGPYLLAYGSGREAEWEMRYLVTGHVLIWTEDGLTYRLESDLSMEEAIRMAESLRPAR